MFSKCAVEKYEGDCGKDGRAAAELDSFCPLDKRDRMKIFITNLERFAN